MKKLIAMMVVLAVAGMAQASLINVQGNFAFGLGQGVYEYTDINGVSEGVFQAGWQVLTFESTTGSDIDFEFGVTDVGTAVGSSVVGTKTSGPGQFTRIEGLTYTVSDNSNVYSVLFNNADAALASNALVLDLAAVAAGTFDPPVAYTPTQLIPATDATIAMGTQVWAVPEPATIGLMGIAGLGMFLARRKTV